MLKKFFTLLSLVALFCLFWYYQALRPVVSSSIPDQEFEVKSGQGLDSISQNLSTQKLIRSRLAFKITVVRFGLTNKIQAGYFRLSPNMDIPTIAQKLTKASSKQARVTLQEGLRREEMALLIENAIKNVNPESSFSATDFVSNTKNLEGQLFPDTYDLDPKSTTEQIITKLHDRYLSVTKDLNIPDERLKSVTILASLIEREAGQASEMPGVASVIANRLAAQWPIQIDAAIQYALTTSRCRSLNCDWWPKSLTKADLQIKSPYNTYTEQGLPPSPICNPGKDSLKAALQAKSGPYWFYLHDLNGEIHLAKTVEEHNQNVCKYLQKDCR